MDANEDRSRQWVVGDTTLTAIVEDETAGIPVEMFFPEAIAADVRSAEGLPPGAVGEDGTIAFRVQAFVLEHREKLIVVDPCVGNDKRRKLPFWNNLHAPWMDRFLVAGFKPDDVDLVVHTHLHEDHLGWDTHLVDGLWVPTFPNARHAYVGAELEWAVSDESGVDQNAFADSIAPIFDGGLGLEVTAHTDLGDGLELVSTPGHTPGHASVVVDTTTEPIVITGDILHHQFQLAHPHIAEVGDCDRELARLTRGEFLAEHAGAGSLLAGTHFPSAPLGRIETVKGTWQFAPEAATTI